MDRFIVYVDDAATAQQGLASLLARQPSVRAQWLLVACAPRMTHRISKWVSHRARENWRDKWADKLFAQILPTLPAHAGTVTTMLAKAPLAELTAQLQAGQPTPAQVVDLRRPRGALEDDAAKAAPAPRWRPALPGTLGSLLTGLGVLCMLGLE